jgi:hypothetical protein
VPGILSGCAAALPVDDRRFAGLLVEELPFSVLLQVMHERRSDRSGHLISAAID